MTCMRRTSSSSTGKTRRRGWELRPDIVRRLLAAGVDAITLGNHTWSKRDIMEYLDQEPRLLRPANYPAGTPGKGYGVFGLPRRRRAGGGRQSHGPDFSWSRWTIRFAWPIPFWNRSRGQTSILLF